MSDSFRSKYLRLLGAQGLSQVCDRMMMMAVIWVLASEVKNPATASWFLAFGTLPHLMLFVWTPKYLKKRGALKAVLNADVVRGWLLIFCFLLLSFNILTLTPAFFFILYFIINIYSAVFNPAMLMLPSLLSQKPEEQKKLMALVETCLSLANVIAPLISVLLFNSFGLKGLILINGLSYLVAWWVEKGFKISPPSQLTDSVSSTSGWAALTKYKPILVYMLGGFLLVNLFLGPLLVLIPLYASRIFNGSIQTVGQLETALAVGTLIGGLSFSIFKYGASRFFKIASWLFLVSLLYLFFTFSTQLAFGLIALSLLGLSLAILNVQILDFFQSKCSENELPTVMNLVNVISVASLPISLAVFGLILNWFPEWFLSLSRILSVASLMLTVIFSLGPFLLRRTGVSLLGEEETLAPWKS